jgi:hypothetical protein
MKTNLPITVLIFVLFLTKPGIAFSQPQNYADSLHDSLKLNMSLSVSRIGLSPIPVPPLEYPCLSSFFSVKKGNWSYDPDFTFALNAKPWMINNWTHYRFVNKNKLQVTAGINPFLYFVNDVSNSRKQVLRTSLNLSAEISADYKISTNWSVNINYRRDKGFNDMVLTGNFFCVGVSYKPDISSSLFIGLNEHLIYFDYPGRLVGIFSSGEVILGSKKIPASVSFQAVQPVACKSVAAPFIWNLSLNISL